jgi:hypothetical protein
MASLLRLVTSSASIPIENAFPYQFSPQVLATSYVSLVVPDLIPFVVPLFMTFAATIFKAQVVPIVVPYTIALVLPFLEAFLAGVFYTSLNLIF